MTVANRLQRSFSSWRTKPAMGEPGYTYFGRLVGEEGLASVRAYANSIGVTTTSILSPEISDKVINLPLSPASKESLERWTPRRIGRFFVISGEKFRIGQISAVHRRFCRGCLGEMKSHRVWWDIVPFWICPIHGCPLEETFGEGRHLKWTWPHYGHAPDGESLIAKLPVIDGSGLFEHYLLQRLRCVSGPPRPLLDDIDLYQVIELCGLVGRFFLHPWQENAPQCEHPYQRGFEALRGTHQDLVSLFESWLLDNAADALKSGIENGFGWIRRGGRGVNLLQKSWRRIDLAQKEAFARHARVTQFRELRGFDFKFITSQALQKELRIQYKLARVFLRKRGLESPDLKYSRDDVEKIRSAIDALLTHKECAALLGCSKKMIRFLVTSGHLEGYLGLTATSEFKIDPDSAKTLAERIATLPVSRKKGTRLTIWNYARWNDITQRKVVKIVLSGTLQPAAIRKDRIGFNALRMANDPPAGAVRSTAREGEVTFGRAKALLGLRHQSIAPLAHAGVLKIVRATSSLSFLSEDSVNAFLARYVEASKYRKELRADRNGIADALAKLDVPRYFTDIDGMHDHIVERNVLLKALGIEEVSAAVQATWQTFSSIVAEHCPAFLLPAILTRSEQTIFNSTRVTRFTAVAVGDRIVIRKKFNPRAAREWRWFQEHKAEVYRVMPTFQFQDVPSRDLVLGAYFLDDKETMAKLAKELGEYHWLLLKKEIR